MKSLFWKKNETKKQGKPPKLEEGCTLTYMKDRNLYIHFGNHKTLKSESSSDPNQPQNSAHNSQSLSSPISFSISKASPPPPQQGIHFYNPVTNQWTFEQTKGRNPGKRLFHSSFYEAPHFFIYGGVSQDQKVLHDMFCLNCETFVWKRFFFLEGPTPRLHSGFCEVGDRKFFFGGVSLPERLVMNDVWTLSFENVVWNSTSLELPGIIWNKIEFQENVPALNGHSVCKINEHSVLIFGGKNSSGTFTDSCFIVDLEAKSIKFIETKGKKPRARAFHKIFPVKENIIVLFGGIANAEGQNDIEEPLNDFYVFNLTERYWSCPSVGGYIPAPRSDFAFSCNESESHCEILIFGGKTKNKDSNIYILSELDQNHYETWGFKDEEEKEKIKFQTYFQDSFAKSPLVINQKELNQMSTSDLQFSEADKLIREQRKKIGEKEELFKSLKEKNDKNVEEKINYEKKFKGLDIECEEKMKMIDDSISYKRIENTQNQDLFKKLKIILNFERKKRKFLQQKTYSLQESLRKSENFIITVDSFYTKSLKDDLLDGIVNEDALEKLDKKKSEHRLILSNFRDEFDNVFKKEKHLKTEMKAKKNLLGNLINFKELLKSSLNPDEKSVLNYKD